MSRRDVLDYATKRAAQAGTEGPFVSVCIAWTLAASRYTEGMPEPIIGMLHQDLEAAEAAATPGEEDERETCSGPTHARSQAAEEAREIVALLWRLAEEYHPTRVWRDQLTRRQAEAQLQAKARETPRYRKIEAVVAGKLKIHCQRYGILFTHLDVCMEEIADAIEAAETVEAQSQGLTLLKYRLMQRLGGAMLRDLVLVGDESRVVTVNIELLGKLAEAVMSLIPSEAK